MFIGHSKRANPFQLDSSEARQVEKSGKEDQYRYLFWPVLWVRIQRSASVFRIKFRTLTVKNMKKARLTDINSPFKFRNFIMNHYFVLFCFLKDCFQIINCGNKIDHVTVWYGTDPDSEPGQNWGKFLNPDTTIMY